MGLLKTALIGAAVYGAFKYLTKKDDNGVSKSDEIREKAMEWMKKAREMKEEMEDEYIFEMEKQKY